MNETDTQYWPTEVPETLWNYALMKAQQPAPFPFMGLRFDPGFQIAFVAGLLFVCFFAWRRFKEKTFDSKLFSYRVLTSLDLTVLRGGAAMRRAYVIYAGTLVILYFAMTFFGKLILQTAGRLPIAGAQVDTSGLNFSSPNWPLMLAFGFAGLAPLIPPLEVAETWLRRRAHQAVGIPTRIDQLARRIIDNFDRQHQGRGESLPDEPPWVITHLGGKAVADRNRRIRQELRAFKDWSEEEDPAWPDRSVRSDLRQLEREIAADARRALQEYADIIRQPYDGRSRGSKEKPEDLQARRNQLHDRLDNSVERIARLRGDMAAIIAVYAEGDPKFEKITKPHHAELRTALKNTFAFTQVRTGPEVALVAAIPVVFVVYLIACTMALYPLLKPVPISALTVGVTAGMETARFAAIFTLPAVAAFALRFYLLDRASWDRAAIGETPRLTPRERLAATALGVGLSVVLLFLVALLFAALLSPTATHFQQLLFRSKNGVLIYYVVQATTSAVFLYGALAACDAGPPLAKTKRRWIGILCGLLVLVSQAPKIVTGGLACAEPGPKFPLGLLDATCFRDNGALDFLIYPLIAYLTCAVFGSLPKSGDVADGERTDGPTEAPTLPGRALAASAIAMVALMLTTAPAHSQPCGDPAQTCGSGPCESCDVKIGMRADAEPFSFRTTLNGGPQFKGYLADLCYAIFQGSAYRLKTVPVTIKSRFKQIKGSDPGGSLDMLCDPVTIRLTDAEQRVVGLYSPIVFASGVTYMLRKSNVARTVAYLGYAKDSTAEGVVRRACELDLLKIREPDEEARPRECDPPPVGEASWRCFDTNAATTNEGRKPREAGKEPAYILCPKLNHTQLIQWFCRSTVTGVEESARVSDALGFHMAYFGDREIIRGKLDAYRKQPFHHCTESGIEVNPSNYTYEPYALVVSLKRPELAQFVQRKVYEFFSHPANPRGLFLEHFPEQQMSPALAYLFLLNGVAYRDPLTVQTLDPADEQKARDSVLAAAAAAEAQTAGAGQAAQVAAGGR